MTIEQAKKASEILQKINSANETIKILYLNDIEGITFNRKSSNFHIIELNVIDSIKTDTIRYLEYIIDILKKELKDL
jgi:hypothetical protein